MCYQYYKPLHYTLKQGKAVGVGKASPQCTWGDEVCGGRERENYSLVFFAHTFVKVKEAWEKH